MSKQTHHQIEQIILAELQQRIALTEQSNRRNRRRIRMLELALLHEFGIQVPDADISSNGQVPADVVQNLTQNNSKT